MADLRRGILARERTAARQPEWRIPAGADADGIRYRRAEGALSAAHGVGTGHLGARLVGTGRGSGHGGDRQSVVEGKSVSVRVDLGGRRIFKKKRKKRHHRNTRENRETKPNREK